MPLTSAFNGAANRVEGFLSSIKSRIYDSFARVTSGTLGTATTGQVWVQNSGLWTANNGVAVTASTASSYPNATIPFKTNVAVSAQSVGQGAGVVFWQSGANDWWAATTSGTSASVISGYSCNPSSCCTGSNTCSPSYCCTGSNTCGEAYDCGNYLECIPSTTCGAYGGMPNACCYLDIHGRCVADAACGATPGTYNACCTRYYYPGVYNACCFGSNNCSYSPCCSGSNNCSYDPCCTVSPTYSTQYSWVLNIIKSVSGTISNVANSTIATSYSNTNQIKGVKAATSGSGVSAQGYSDNALTTTLGSPVTATAPSSPTGTGVGIILTPGGTNQGNSVGPFTAQ